MKRKIPVMIGNRQIAVEHSDKTKEHIYNKFHAIYRVKKVYHPYTPKERFVIETK
jgi:hypothetical protein